MLFRRSEPFAVETKAWQAMPGSLDCCLTEKPLMAKLTEVISKAALPSVGIFLIGFGLGGKQLPSVDAVLDSWENWLGSHTSYPSLIVACNHFRLGPVSVH
jgi:hypothetical protein